MCLAFNFDNFPRLMLLAVQTGKHSRDESLTCVVGVGEPSVDVAEYLLLNLRHRLALVLSLLGVETLEVFLMDVDYTTNNVRVALTRQSVVNDGEGILKDASGEDAGGQAVCYRQPTRVVGAAYIEGTGGISSV